MAQVSFRRFEQILHALLTRVMARSTLTGVDDASGVKHILAAVAREIEEWNYQLLDSIDAASIFTAEGADLDRRAAEAESAPARRQAQFATGSVTFSRGTPAVTLVTIPPGTVVKTATGVSFITTASGSISIGTSSSAAVPVRALVAGTAGNVESGTVTGFSGKPSGVDAVTNTAKISNGVDRQTDDEFRAALIAWFGSLARCHPLALKTGAQSAVLADGSRVVFAHVVRDPVTRGRVELYVDDGSGTIETFVDVLNENVTAGLAGPPANSAVGGEEYLSLDNKPVRRASGITVSSSTRGALTEGTHYWCDETEGELYFSPALTTGEVITATYAAFTGLIREAQKIINGDGTSAYPGYAAAGDQVIVLPPQILQVTVEASVLIREGFSSATVLPAVRSALQDYVNGLGISGDIVRAELIARIMRVAGVQNCTVVQPASDVVVLDDVLPRLLDVNTIIT